VIGQTDPARLFAPFCDVWTINPYAACEFRCVYCITQAQGESRPKMAADAVRPQLRRELAEEPAKFGIVVGGMSDAYPTVEAEHGLTRRVLEELVAQGRDFHIVTKGLGILRDLDLLVPHRHAVKVQVSLSSLDDAVLRELDPGAPSATARLALVARLVEAGLDVTIAVTPWIPGVTDVDAIVARAPAAAGVQLGPLTVPVWHDGIRLLGRRWTQDEIDRGYLEERRRLGANPRLRWLYPAGPARESDRVYLVSFMPPEQELAG
jgi:DNA repair photolyase